MGLPKNIVIVEDEVITQRHLQDILAQVDVNVSGCFDNASNTIEALKNIDCDMILMDINIKGPVDGIQLSKKILETHTLPIVFITAHNDDATLEELLELAPYGFIGKPFSSKEILVTLKIAYKRYLIHTEASGVNKTSNESNDIAINEYYSYSRDLSVLYYDGKAVKMNKKQSKLIGLLSQNVNHTVSYDVLISQLWEDDTVADSTLRTLVYSVRKLLPDLPIISHSKVGYSLQSSHLI
ncbi:response regulator [Sulfurovum sp.]|uniref:response regulator n=1 Tax=Sulfurovum sp. TaxID=1969726 RepID=UPI0035630E03